jgi:tetratricopeptide (TPR) repeat protein
MTARRLRAQFAILVLVATCAIPSIGHATDQAAITDVGSPPQQQTKTDETLDSLKAAVKRNKSDVVAWNHLGLALEQIGDTKEAAKTHEKAARLGDKLLVDHLNKVQSGTEFPESLASLRTNLTSAGASAERYLELTKPSGKKLQEWKLRADSLNAFAGIANSPPGTPSIYSAKEVSVKARIISKPEPQYTEDARRSQITGLVVLRAILAANGSVVAVRVVRGLGGGLSQQAHRCCA